MAVSARVHCAHDFGGPVPNIPLRFRALVSLSLQVASTPQTKHPLANIPGQRRPPCQFPNPKESMKCQEAV